MCYDLGVGHGLADHDINMDLVMEIGRLMCALIAVFVGTPAVVSQSTWSTSCTTAIGYYSRVVTCLYGRNSCCAAVGGGSRCCSSKICLSRDYVRTCSVYTESYCCPLAETRSGYKCCDWYDYSIYTWSSSSASSRSSSKSYWDSWSSSRSKSSSSSSSNYWSEWSSSQEQENLATAKAADSGIIIGAVVGGVVFLILVIIIPVLACRNIAMRNGTRGAVIARAQPVQDGPRVAGSTPAVPTYPQHAPASAPAVSYRPSPQSQSPAYTVGAAPVLPTYPQRAPATASAVSYRPVPQNYSPVNPRYQIPSAPPPTTGPAAPPPVVETAAPPPSYEEAVAMIVNRPKT